MFSPEALCRAASLGSLGLALCRVGPALLLGNPVWKLEDDSMARSEDSARPASEAGFSALAWLPLHGTSAIVELKLQGKYL